MDPMLFLRPFEQMQTTFMTNLSEALRNKETLEQVGKVMDLGLEGKQLADAAMRKSLEMMNFPTREDLARALEFLQRIETRLLDLEEKLEDLGELVKVSAVQVVPPVAQAPVTDAAPETVAPVKEEAAAPKTSTKAPASKAAPKTSAPKTSTKAPASKTAPKTSTKGTAPKSGKGARK